MDENKELKEALKTLASKQGVTGRFTSLVTLENREAAVLLAHIEAQDKCLKTKDDLINAATGALLTSEHGPYSNEDLERAKNYLFDALKLKADS